jgi:uracil-DNA glycosylase family 4
MKNLREKDSIACVREDVLACRRCPRLNAWRAEAAAHPPKRFAGQKYHALPVPGFGDAIAWLWIVGLAPAAHGGNRTGRIFTGDRSGDWLFGALHRFGIASQAESISADDGMKLRGAYISAAVRCAPPDNKPTPEETKNCSEYVHREYLLLAKSVRVIVPLGSFALDSVLNLLAGRGILTPKPKPKFGHGNELDLGADHPRILMSFHPSQQNTFTGKLTPVMFDAIWKRAIASREK